MAATVATTAEQPKAGTAAFGTRLLEFVVTGGLTPLLFPIAWVLRRSLGLDAAMLAVGFTMFHAAHVINDPHFAVTYVLFYEDARARAFGNAFSPIQRLRWILAGVVAPVALIAWAAYAIRAGSAQGLGLMVQLMYLLVGWHYVKQGFGVMSVLSARRGVRFSPRERLAMLAHCYAGWAYAWATPFDPGRELEEKGVVYRSFAHPRWLEGVTLAVLLATIPPLLYVLWRRRKEPIWTGVIALLCSVWPWSIYSSVDPLVIYFIPALHSIQYLYFVYLLKGNEAREREAAPHFERSAKVRLGILVASALGLGWVLFHGLPSFLDDGLVSKQMRLSDLGETPYFAAVYTFVNLHHYFMDSVIWRRDNPLTRYMVTTR